MVLLSGDTAIPVTPPAKFGLVAIGTTVLPKRSPFPARRAWIDEARPEKENMPTYTVVPSGLTVRVVGRSPGSDCVHGCVPNATTAEDEDNCAAPKTSLPLGDTATPITYCPLEGQLYNGVELADAIDTASMPQLPSPLPHPT
jgi:hypothetical protein